MVVTRADGHSVEQVYSMSQMVLKVIECKLDMVPLNLTLFSLE